MRLPTAYKITTQIICFESSNISSIPVYLPRYIITGVYTIEGNGKNSNTLRTASGKKLSGISCPQRKLKIAYFAISIPKMYVVKKATIPKQKSNNTHIRKLKKQLSMYANRLIIDIISILSTTTL